MSLTLYPWRGAHSPPSMKATHNGVKAPKIIRAHLTVLHWICVGFASLALLYAVMTLHRFHTRLTSPVRYSRDLHELGYGLLMFSALAGSALFARSLLQSRARWSRPLTGVTYTAYAYVLVFMISVLEPFVSVHQQAGAYITYPDELRVLMFQKLLVVAAGLFAVSSLWMKGAKEYLE